MDQMLMMDKYLKSFFVYNICYSSFLIPYLFCRLVDSLFFFSYKYIHIYIHMHNSWSMNLEEKNVINILCFYSFDMKGEDNLLEIANKT